MQRLRVAFGQVHVEHQALVVVSGVDRNHVRVPRKYFHRRRDDIGGGVFLLLIDARQKTEDALDAGFELAKARLGLLRALGHMIDWLNELHGK